MVVNDPKGKQLSKSVRNNQPYLFMVQDKDRMLRYQFTTLVSGNHQICVSNNDSKERTFDFKIQTGIEAKDYSSIITKKHLRPVEVQAQKVQDMVAQLRQELSYLVESEEKLRTQNASIKSRVFIFGLISILVMLGSTYLQITYLKNFFRYKKII